MDEKRKVTQEELESAEFMHNKWIEDEKCGDRAVFENCSFERLSLKNMQFNNAVLRNCEFRLCDMTDAGMCFAELNNVKFSGCDCTMFTAEEAAFRNVTFDKCDLKSAVFTHSSLRNIAFDKCETDGMSMQNCYELPEAQVIRISAEDLRKMSDKEGLILQGCGGDLQEWADGINSALIDTEILRHTAFEKMYVFENEGHTNIMFPFEDVELDVGKLAMWRLQTHEQFGGTWLSDYVPNRLGGFIEEQPAQEQKKPDCPLIGEDSNIFNLMGIASKTLKKNGMAEQAKEMCERITSSGDYNKALCIIGEYVNITSVDDDIDESEDEGLEVTMNLPPERSIMGGILTTGCEPPIPWIGGKTILLPVIKRIIPEGQNKFVDVFGGGGSVSLSGKYAPIQIYNDYNQHLTNFYTIIKTRCRDLVNTFAGAFGKDGKLVEEIEQRIFANIRDQFNACCLVFYRADTFEEFYDSILKMLNKAGSIQDKQHVWMNSMLAWELYKRREKDPELFDALMFLILMKCSFSATGKSWACKGVNGETAIRLINEASRVLY